MTRPQAARIDPDDVEEFWRTMSRRVAVDYDATIHPYTKGWTGSEPDDEPPIPGAEEFLLGLLRDGFDVVIFSTRADHRDGEEGIIRWLHKHMPPIFYAMRDGTLPGGGQRAGCATVSHVKPAAVAYVDDRAVPFTGDYAAARAEVDRLAAGRPHGAGAPPPGYSGLGAPSDHPNHPHGSLVEQVHRVMTTDQGTDPWTVAEAIVEVTRRAVADSPDGERP